jgi:hypothetical protein
MAEGNSMHVRNPHPVMLEVDTCPARDVILRWRIAKDDHLTGDMLSLEVSIDQALLYAEEIIRTAQFAIVRNVMHS